METALCATSEGMSVREASEGMSVTKEGAASGKEDYDNSHPHTVLTCSKKALKDQAGETGIHNSSLPTSVKCILLLFITDFCNLSHTQNLIHCLWVAHTYVTEKPSKT